MSHERSLIVELDGGHHADQRDYDDWRTQWLESQGFKVLRFWNGDVLRGLDSVVEALTAGAPAVSAGLPLTLTLSLKGEGTGLAPP